MEKLKNMYVKRKINASFTTAKYCVDKFFRQKGRTVITPSSKMDLKFLEFY